MNHLSQLLNQTTIENHPELLSKKTVVEAVETLRLFESGDEIVYKDTLLSLQNTNRENYPEVIQSFITDVNKSCAIVMKSIVSLHSDESTKGLLAENMYMCGHEIFVEDGKAISLTIKKHFEDFFSDVKRHSLPIMETIQRQKWLIGVNNKELESIKLFVERLSRELQNDKVSALRHPKTINSHIRKALESPTLKTIAKEDIDLEKSLRFFDATDFKFLFDNIPMAVNMADLGIIQKKSLPYPLGKNVDGETFWFLSLEACSDSAKGGTIKYNWVPDFTIEFHLKKFMIEKYSGVELFTFVGAVRDYLFFDYYRNWSCVDEWDQSHPQIIGAESSNIFENRIDDIKLAYTSLITTISLFENKKILCAEWLKKMPPQHIEHFDFSYYLKDDKTLSSSDFLNILNTATKEKIGEIISQTLSSKSSKEFKDAKTTELFIYEVIKRILDTFYNSEISQRDFSKSQNRVFRDRATFHTPLQKSIILDCRKSIDAPFLNKAAEDFFANELFGPQLYEVMRTHPYHDYYELDLDFLSGESIITPEALLNFLSHSKLLNIPNKYKCGFKLRKLGNYKASGIYFSHSRTLGLDFRGKNSYVHEMAHHIDLNKTFQGRKLLIQALGQYFTPKIKERRDYYLRPEELIARAAEISFLLRAGNYANLKKLYSDDSKKLIDVMTTNFNNSKVSKYMESWDYYSTSVNYLDIKELIRAKQTELLDRVYDYFGPFWGWSNVYSDKWEHPKYNSLGFDSTKIGTMPYKNSRSFLHQMAEVYGMSYGNFDKDKLIDAITDFMETSVPMAAKIEYDIAENVKNIKKLWVAYNRINNDNDFISAYQSSGFTVILDEESRKIVEKDFADKFGEEINYGIKLQNLKKLFDLILSSPKSNF